jgi:hypothetical protein
VAVVDGERASDGEAWWVADEVGGGAWWAARVAGADGEARWVARMADADDEAL